MWAGLILLIQIVGFCVTSHPNDFNVEEHRCGNLISLMIMNSRDP
jgi:hypothetical protein